MIPSPVILWLALMVGFLVLEACTVALVSVWFAAGALAALLLSLAGAGFGWQTGVFLVVSGLLLSLLRPMMRKHIKGAKTNIDSVIGSQGLVTTAIDNIAYTGEVKLGAMTWTARSTSGVPIPQGTKVCVDRIEGVKVFVSPVEAYVSK